MEDEIIKREFLKLHVIEQHNYKTITEMLKIDRSVLSKWYDELQNEREEIAEIMVMHSRKKINASRLEFYTWFINQERRCQYCGVSEAEIKIMLDNGSIKTRNAKIEGQDVEIRGRKLELDRKDPKFGYEMNNIVWACYWCNNAKTDAFDADEFRPIGLEIAKIWKKKLSQ